MKYIRNTLKSFALITMALVAIFLSEPVQGQTVNTTTVNSITAGTAANILAGRYVVPTLQIVNGSAGAVATIKLYDKATAVTNQVRPAYTSIGSVYSATAYTVVFTNQFGIVDTNYLAGTLYWSTNYSAVTNEATRIATLAVPAAGTASIDINYLTTLGLTVLADTNITLTTTYRVNP